MSNESLTGKAFALHSKAKKSPKVLDTNRRKIRERKRHHNPLLTKDQFFSSTRNKGQLVVF